MAILIGTSISGLIVGTIVDHVTAGIVIGVLVGCFICGAFEHGDTL